MNECVRYAVAGYVYRREGQTLDQVLFSEPSTKMKQRMEVIRQESAKEASAAAAVKRSESSSDGDDDVDLSDVDRFLNDKFK